MQDNIDNNKDKIKRITQVLPKINCGECGFENCGKFAIAVVEGKASPFGCRQDSSVGYEISKIIGLRIPEVATQPSYSGILGSNPAKFQAKGIRQGRHYHGGMSRGKRRRFGQRKRRG